MKVSIELPGKTAIRDGCQPTRAGAGKKAAMQSVGQLLMANPLL
ncbi:MAG: hypothetical protein V4718_10360 [Pseudomonadota bacterium]